MKGDRYACSIPAIDPLPVLIGRNAQVAALARLLGLAQAGQG